MSEPTVRLRLPNVVAAVRETPWAILPSKLEEICAVVSAHAAGGALPARHDPYAARRDAMRQRTPGAVAVVPIYGSLVPRAGLMSDLSGATSAESIAQQVSAAAADPAISAIVLDVDSPGGSVFGIPETAQAIAEAAQAKRVVAVVNTMAASAAYWLASQATEIVASPSSMSGNIGVIMAHLDTSEADAKDGIRYQVASAGTYKHEGHYGAPLSDDAMAAMQSMVDDYYTQFVAAVATGRRVAPTAVRAGFGEGRVLTAQQALAAGVVDRIATLDAVLAECGATSPGVRTPMRAAAPDLALVASSPTSVTITADGVAERAIADAVRAAVARGLVLEQSPTSAAPVAVTEAHRSHDLPHTAPAARSLPVEHNTTAATGAAPADPMAAERTRVREIAALGRAHNIDATRVDAWIGAGTSVADVGLAILNDRQTAAAAAPVVAAATPRAHVSEPRETQRPFASFADYLTSVRAAAQAPHAIDARLLPLQGPGAFGTGQQASVGADGGFLIPTQYGSAIMERAYESGAILSRVTRIPLQGGRYVVPVLDETSRANGSRFGGIRGFWQGEADNAVLSKMKFGEMVLAPNKLTVYARVTEEQMQDAPATASYLEQGFAEEVVFMTEQAIWEGLGAGQPLGVTNSPALVTQAAEAGQAAATVVVNNITKMLSRLAPRSQARAAWFHNPDVFPAFPQLQIGNFPAFVPPGGISEAPNGTLLGKPTIAVEYASTLGTTGDLVLADLSQYLLGERSGPDLQRSMHVAFLAGEEVFRLTYRVDGQPAWKSPITPLKGTNTVSPFVALATRS